jgi:hypothetical protein
MESQDKLARRLNNLQYLKNLRERVTDPEVKTQLRRYEGAMLKLAKKAMQEQAPSGSKM